MLVLVVTFLAFLPALSAGFVNWDDNVNLLENPNLQVFNWESIVGIFTSDVIGNYNPLPILTFAIEKAVFGLNSTVFHLNNVILHLICTYFVYRLMLVWKLNPLAAAFAALLFGIHPMRVESVAWVTERKDVLFGVFFLPALWLYSKNVATNRENFSAQPVAILGLFVLALFSKIQAVALPLSMLAVDYYFRRPLNFKLLTEKWAYFALSLFFGLLGVFILGEQGSLEEAANFTFIDRLFIGAYSYVVYLFKLIFPYPLSTLYPYPAQIPYYFYLAPLPIAALFFGLFKAYQKGYRSIVFAFAFFTFNVMFLLQILGAGQGFLADRFTYIPYLGFFFLAAYAYHYFTSKRPTTRTIWHIALGSYLAILTITTFQQTMTWKNSDTLWSQVIKHYPRTTTAFTNRGHFFRDNGNFAEAIKNYDAALNINPNKAEIYNSRGKLYFENGQTQRAIDDYTTGINEPTVEQKTLAELHANRGGAYGAAGKIDLALQDLNKSVELDPEFINAYLNRSIAYFQRGQYDLAIQDYTAYLQRDPYRADIWYERGLARYNLQLYTEGLADFNQAIQLDSGKGVFYLMRSQTYNALGNQPQALVDAQTAQQLGAQVDPAYLQSLRQ
ncbi:MAG: tetratricopeptide repeat protein [Saprospiraceae bacterium]